MIAQRATKLQPALFPQLENSTKVESPAQPTPNTLVADPLIDEYRQAKRRAMARTVCQYAATPCSWELADKLARSLGFSCAELGVAKPADPEGDRRRRQGVCHRG